MFACEIRGLVPQVSAVVATNKPLPRLKEIEGVPAARHVAMPLEEIVASDGFRLDQITSLMTTMFCAPWMVEVALHCALKPTGTLFGLEVSTPGAIEPRWLSGGSAALARVS